MRIRWRNLLPISQGTPRYFCTRPWRCCCKNGRGGSGGTPKPKATPLPLLKLIVVCSAVFVNQFGINMIFPFLPFMIHDFFPYLDRTELGHKAGYLGSSYFFGNFVGSLFWGWASDKLGRRPILITGVCTVIAAELLFGFSQNFVWAIIARLLWGMLNGNIGVAKTYISEICDDTNQAKGFAVIGTFGGVARLLGSTIGGFLARPASKYSVLQVGFFCQFPYSLPCIVGASISVLSLFATWLFLDETLKRPATKLTELVNETSEDSFDSPHSNDSGIELQADSSQAALLNDDIIESSEEESSERELFEIDDSESVSDYDVNSDTELISRVRIKRRFSVLTKYCRDYKKKCRDTFSLIKLAHLVVRRTTDCIGGFYSIIMYLYKFDFAKLRPGSLRKKTVGCGGRLLQGLIRGLKLMLDRKVFLSITLYGVIAFLAIISNELLPLLLVTSHQHGGYDMDDSEIGIILMTAAIAQLLFQFFLFPLIAKFLGYRHTYKLGCALFAVSVALLPLANRISGPISSPTDNTFSGSGSGNGSDFSDSDSLTDFCGTPLYASDNVTATSINMNSVSRIPARVWVVIFIITVVLVMSRMITITSVMVLISNSTMPETRGTVNGFGQATAALGRMLGPILGSPLFAWSETSGKGWPLNYHLTFDLTALGSVGAIFLCLLLPASIERKRDSLTTAPVTPVEETVHDENVSEPSTSDDDQGSNDQGSK